MIYLGIDYGSKRIGIAYSEESGSIAMPLTVLKNDKQIIENILTIVKEKKTECVVVGESKDLKGNDNPISKDIEKFKKNLEEKNIRVEYEREFFTSMHATEGGGDKIDASAAALILQRYLDRQKHKETSATFK